MPLNVSLGRGLPEFGDVAVDESQVSTLSLGKMRLWLGDWFSYSRRYRRTLCRIDHRAFGILSESSNNVPGTVAGCSFNQRISDAVHLLFGQAKTDSMRQQIRHLVAWLVSHFEIDRVWSLLWTCRPDFDFPSAVQGGQFHDAYY